MKPPRILLPFAVAGLALAAAFATAALVNAADTPPKGVAKASPPPAEVKALFAVAPLSASQRARLVGADPALMRAEREALFAVARRPAPQSAKTVKRP